jgi:colanic acid biosynthesis glycosyl transferase WcaI
VRVTLLTQYYPPEVGAPQARIAALAAGLRQRGLEVTVHTCFPHYPDGGIRAPYRNRLVSREWDRGGGLVRSAVYPAANRGFARRLAGHASFAASALITASSTGPADVVVVESPPLFLAGAAIAYARVKRAQLVVNVADLWPDSAIELGALRSSVAIRAARAIERAAYRTAAAIVCPTAGIEATLEQRPESTGKTVLMRPAVDLERFEPDTATTASTASNAIRPLRVLYAGTVGMAHGLGTLLDAAEELERSAGVPPIEVVIAGGGAEAPELGARLADGGPNGMVRMLGVVPSEQVPSLYAASDVAVVMLRDLPIFHGALPTKMLEAMAAGRPVVLAARGEAARLIEEKDAGVVVEPENPEALAAALAALAADPGRRRQLGGAGRRAAEQAFGREDWLDRWSDLLLGARDRRAEPGQRIAE